jgi:hypothetical protein
MQGPKRRFRRYAASMKQVEKWKWRIRWAGAVTITRVHFTEAEIHREHPEAVKIPETRIVVDLPETDAEIQAAQRNPNRGAQ